MNPRSSLFRLSASLVSAVMFAGVLMLPDDGFAATRKRNPVSKIYVADQVGEAEIDNGDKIEDLKDKSVHDASGAGLKTKDASNSSVVYSNGAGVFLEPDTDLKIRSFVQEPFTPNRNDLEVEPSISKTDAFLSLGSVGICSSKLVAGSRMVYHTPLASVNIRARRVVIQSNDKETKISVVEGDVTVSAGENDVGGQIIRSGQQAIIRPGGGADNFIVQPIPASERKTVEDKVVKACMARRTVYFEVADRKGNVANAAEGATSVFGGDSQPPPQEIVPVPIITPPPPTEKPISPARLTR